MEPASFEFHQCLGRGGYGEVYLATQSRGGLDKRVAVKVLKGGLSNHELAVKRLKDEGRMLGMLDHPAILAVHEMTNLEGRIALVMEYVEGIDLSRCARRGFLLPPRVVCGALAEVASALHCAYTTPAPESGKPLRLVHRDIKPQNIRLSKHGAVKLLDFGIAKSMEMTREAKTAAGDLPLTPGYAAPESFTLGLQEAPSDVYALGSTLFRLTTGEKLYEGVRLNQQLNLAASKSAHVKFVENRIKALHQAETDIVDLIRTCLAYDAEERPTAAETQTILEALSDTLRGDTVVRWARKAKFPDPPSLSGASLTGRTVSEGDGGNTIRISREEIDDLLKPVAVDPGARTVLNKEVSLAHMETEISAVPYDVSENAPSPASQSSGGWWKIGIPLVVLLIGAVVVLAILLALLAAGAVYAA